jgi:hypothetical protein
VPDRELDLALAQQRVSAALAPDEVIAAAPATLLPRTLSGTPRLLAAGFGFAVIAAGAWFSYHARDPWWPTVVVLTPLHVRAMLRPRQRKHHDCLLAITRGQLALTDCPGASAPVRVIFAGPVQALRLDVRQRRRVATFRCTAADGGHLILFGRRRRELSLAVQAGPPASGVLEAFQTRGGAVIPAAAAMTTIPA